MILRARIVAPLDGPPIENGAVAIEGNQIVAVGTVPEVIGNAADGEVTDLGEVALMPGLINAHCHLDYTVLRYAIHPPKSFSAWVQRLNAIKRGLSADDYVRSITRGFDECVKWGTTSVCTIESFPEIMQQVPDPPLRTWWFYEMIDVRHRITSEDVVLGALGFFQRRSGSLATFGLSPHAPYTASLPLYRLSNRCADSFNMPVTTHLAESAEEFEMFRHSEGPLYTFLKSLNRPMEDCGDATPFAHLWCSGAVNAKWLLVHMNELTENDFTLLHSLTPEQMPTIVHCPGSHEYFGHRPFAWKRLQALGANLCVATDSLASTDSLSLLREVRRLAHREPELTSEQLLHTITRNPARALGRGDVLGKIVPGALADLIAVPTSAKVGSVHEVIVAFTQPIPWMMIDGQILRNETDAG